MDNERLGPTLTDAELATADQRLKQFRVASHPRCIICSETNPLGLNLHYTLNPDGSVGAAFSSSQVFEGYPGVLHGGVIAALLDGAMTNCLFAHGIQAVTGKLTVRYQHSVRTGQPIQIRAWIESRTPLAYETQASLLQEGQIKCVATALFMNGPKNGHNHGKS